MARMMKLITLILALAFAVTVVLNLTLGEEITLTLAITFGVTLYHFAMRLAVGGVIDAVMKNQANYNAWWFRPRKGEEKFYSFLRVRKWKKFAPTYAPDTFDIKERTIEQIAMATCQAEVVHEVIVALSFLPLLLIIWFGEPLVFIITSLVSALIDTVFIILQRFNRPRLVKIIERSKK